EALTCENSRLAAELAVTHTLDWTTAHRSEAKILTMYRREDLLALWPDELGEDLASLNDGVRNAVTSFTIRHFGAANAETLGKVRFALIDLPYAAARHAIRGEQPPPWLTRTVIAAAMAVLETAEAAT
ncbi:MAG TPA: hypothetical protein VI076_05280, partial [Actinopolymorphaceae bacterium]